MTGSERPVEDERAAPASLEWRVWLARRQPGRAAAVIGIVALVVAAGLSLFRSPLMALAGAALLMGAVGEFLFPTRYRLTAAGAEVRNLVFWRRLAWTEVKRVYAGED